MLYGAAGQTTCRRNNPASLPPDDAGSGKKKCRESARRYSPAGRASPRRFQTHPEKRRRELRPTKEGEKHNCNIKEPAMKVLQNERKRGLAAVRSSATFAHRAGRRIEEKRSIVGLSVVVTGGAKSERAGQNQKCWRKSPPVMVRIDQRRIKRREVRAPGIELPFEGAKGGIDSERAQNDEDQQSLNPPCVPPQRATETSSRPSAEDFAMGAPHVGR